MSLLRNIGNNVGHLSARVSQLVWPASVNRRALDFSASPSPPLPDINRNTRKCADAPARKSIGSAYFPCRARGIRASTMVDVAAEILGLVSVGIFVAHAVDAYWNE
jgi:hypothetical protein